MKGRGNKKLLLVTESAWGLQSLKYLQSGSLEKKHLPTPGLELEWHLQRLNKYLNERMNILKQL